MSSFHILGFRRSPNPSQAGFETQIAGSLIGPAVISKRRISATAPPQGIELVIVERRVDESRPVFGFRDGAFGQDSSPRRGASAADAGPLPVGGFSYEVRPDRISFDVANHSQKVAVLLNRKRLEPALPDAPGRAVNLVIAANM